MPEVQVEHIAMWLQAGHSHQVLSGSDDAGAALQRIIEERDGKCIGFNVVLDGAGAAGLT